MGRGDFSALSLFRFHLSPFPPETPDTQATVRQKSPFSLWKKLLYNVISVIMLQGLYAWLIFLLLPLK